MEPLVSGRGEFVYDISGNEYIDAISGVYNVSYGHAHPRIIKAIQTYRKSGLIHCYDNPTLERLSLEKQLRQLTDFSEVHLFSTGAEAVEKALMLALKSVTESRRNVLHFASGFHGKTMGTYGLFDSRQIQLPYPDLTVLVSSDETKLLATIESDLEKCGVLILEPVMAYYGHMFSEVFLKDLQDLCADAGTVLIFDEMVTGFGRTGVNFVSDKVKPDILVTGKGLGQGLPISAVLFDSVSRVNNYDFSWTTGTSNNAFLCRIGSVSCDILVEEKMVEKSLVVGRKLMYGLTELAVVKEKFTTQGIGSMVFLRLEPGYRAETLEKIMRERHRVLTRGHGRTLVLMPPYVSHMSSIARIVSALLKSLSVLVKEDEGEEQKCLDLKG